MSRKPAYKRVIVKISGESFCPPGAGGIDPSCICAVVGEFAPLVEMGVEVGIVVGGGNIIRGRDVVDVTNDDRAEADYMGMLATVINAIALQSAMRQAGIDAVALSAVHMPSICLPYTRRDAMEHLDNSRVLLLAGGTGNPFFTTDTGAALRASELGADALLKATKVDGVFDCDPAENPHAAKYDRLDYRKVLSERLGVMDLAAVSLCMDGRIPIVVFQLTLPGNLAAAVAGEKVGTVISG